MADSKFNLAQALQNDRNFYLSMADGQNAASPIAAYLAAASGVKAAQLTDEAQEAADAEAAARATQKRRDQYVAAFKDIASGIEKGDIGKEAGALLLGKAMSEGALGTPTGYDADNGVFYYKDENGQDMEIPLANLASKGDLKQEQQRANIRRAEAAARASDELANLRARTTPSAGRGGTSEYQVYNGWLKANPKLTKDYASNDMFLRDLSDEDEIRDEDLTSYLEGYETLSDKYKQQNRARWQAVKEEADKRGLSDRPFSVGGYDIVAE